MKKIVLYVFLSSVLSSCSNHQDNGFQTIVKPDKLVEVPLNEMAKAGYFYEIKNYIIMQDPYSTNEGIFLFDKNSLNYLGKTGKIGRGPNEIGRYGSIFCKKDYFYITDFGKQKIWKFNIDSVINNEKYYPKPILDFQLGEGIDPYQFYIKDDSLYFMSMDNSYFKKYITPQKTIPIGDNKFSHQRISGLENIFDSPKQVFSFNADHSKMALGFRYDNVLLVLDSKFNVLNRYIEGKKPVFKNDIFSDKAYYLGLKSDANFIYAKFLGEPSSIEDKKFGNHHRNPPHKFRVFDWNCKPVVEFQFESEFSDFFVDASNKRVIVFQLNSENPLKYFEYDMEANL